MATLQKQNGKYWCIVKSVRVNGKPRPKILAYLGTAENLLEKINGKKPVSSKSYEYGTVAVVDHFLKKLGVEKLFNNIVFQKNKIPIKNGLTFGQTMMLIIFQRAIHPESKRAFGSWAKKTFLPTMYNFDCNKTNSQHFWDMMDYVSKNHVEKIEFEIAKKIICDYKLELDLLLYDYTNFFTYVATTNTRNTIAQRGKNKQKRNDLRQFCLALMIVKGLKMPIFSDIYEGNKSDSNEFKDSINKIKSRLLLLSQQIESVTIVFDKGSNSDANFKLIEDINYIAAFSVYHDKELKNISYNEFYNLEKGDENLKCYRTQKKIWGTNRTVVMYKSETLYEGQLRGFEEDIKKTKEAIKKLEKKVLQGYYIKKKKKKKWSNDILERDADSIINKQFVRDIVEYKITKLENDNFKIKFKFSTKKKEELKNKVLGKKILITSRHDWSDENIINGYHGQFEIEHTFKQIKNPFHNCVRPQYHWTDQKIIVHTYCSLLSMTVSSLIEKVAKENGFDMSINEIYNRLQDIRKAKYIYPGTKKNSYEVEYKLEEVEEEINLKLFNTLMK